MEDSTAAAAAAVKKKEKRRANTLEDFSSFPFSPSHSAATSLRFSVSLLGAGNALGNSVSDHPASSQNIVHTSVYHTRLGERPKRVESSQKSLGGSGGVATAQHCNFSHTHTHTHAH